MIHPILKTLDNYGLNDRNTLRERIRKIEPADWLQILNYLENEYKNAQSSSESHTERLQPLHFSFPSLPTQLLPRILPHVLVSEKTFLDDPLYDCLTAFAEGSEAATESFSSLPKIIFEPAIRSFLPQIEQTIDFFLRSRDLISTGRLIPFKDLRLLPPLIIFNPIHRVLLSNKSLQSHFGLTTIILEAMSATANRGAIVNKGVRPSFDPKVFLKKPRMLVPLVQIWSRVAPYLIRAQFSRGDARRKHAADGLSQIASEWANALQEIALFNTQVVGFFYWLVSNDFRGTSTDLLSSERALIYRLMVGAISDANALIPPESRLVLPADIGILGIDVPLLDNVPPEYILDLAAKEGDAYENFRGALNEKLLSITAEIGTTEREIQIQRIRESLTKNVSDISLAYQNLQRDFSRRTKLNLAITTSSIFVAGLSALSRNLDAIAIAGGVAAGAGLTQGIKEFAKDWLDHQRELEKLKTSDNYFIWKAVGRNKS
ncbi:MAG: hypothetical protein HY070_00480 [Chloroflexi bacterium]|nr:hypothetical protein [Chloroflexota bacterium]MBI3742575.1 hypothetical protein [Chloroflexota bacterium]